MDLGAAYGRVGVVLGFLRPMVQFVGYEYVPERVKEGNRIFKKWNLTQAELKHVDLAEDEFELRDANLYFIYDFGSKNDIYKANVSAETVTMIDELEKGILDGSVVVDTAFGKSTDEIQAIKSSVRP